MCAPEIHEIVGPILLKIPPVKKLIRIAAYVLAGSSFIPLIGVPIGLAAVVIGLFTFRKGGKKLALFGAAGICFTIVLLLSLAGYLIKDVPSVYEHPVPFCEGKNSSIKGQYLSFDQLPVNTLRVLKVAEPNIYSSVARTLEYRMQDTQRVSQGVGHLRGAVMMVWIKQYKESDLIAYYLNKIYFGGGCYGIDAAAKFYFKKDITLLSLEETAELFAMLKSYSEYSIIDHPDRNKERANFFLKKMSDGATDK